MHSLVVLCETNVLSLISQRLDNYYQIQTKRYSVQQYRYSAPDSGGADSGHELNAALLTNQILGWDRIQRDIGVRCVVCQTIQSRELLLVNCGVVSDPCSPDYKSMNCRCREFFFLAGNKKGNRLLRTRTAVLI